MDVSSDEPVPTAQQSGLSGATTGIWASDDALLTARQAAGELNISLPAFWNGVAEELLPAPIYVLPRAPRWRRFELRAVLETRRMLPADAKLARRTGRENVLNGSVAAKLKPADGERLRAAEGIVSKRRPFAPRTPALPDADVGET